MAFQEELRKLHEIQYYPKGRPLNTKDQNPMKHPGKPEGDWRTRRFETQFILTINTTDMHKESGSGLCICILSPWQF